MGFTNFLPTEPRQEFRLNVVLAVAWFLFGIWGLLDYLFGGLGIAESIPILFFISVYANTAGHWSAAAANKTEIKLDESN